MQQKPLGYVQDAALGAGAAKALPSIPKGASVAVLNFSGAVRFRDDGTDPTTSVGQPIAANVEYTYTGNLGAFKAISQAGTITANVLYYDVLQSP